MFPGQVDVLEGKAAFRSASKRKASGGSQSAISFRLNADGKINEARGFIDTEQWKAAL